MRTAAGRRRRPWRAAAAMLVLAALAGCGPLGAAGDGGAQGHAQGQSQGTDASAPAGEDRTTEPSPAEPADASATPTATPSPAPATAVPPADPLPAGPVTALLLGTDSRDPASFEGNADAIVVVQLSADRETLALVSVSRDSWVTIPGHGQAKINASFAIGGTELAAATVSELFGGLDFDYVVQTNFRGFLDIVEAVDGFWVENRNPAFAGFSSAGEVDLDAGTYDFTDDPILLDDNEAIYYVRQRFELPYGDLDRAERTRAALIGLLERLDELADDPPALTAALVHIAGSVRLTGELPVADMVALVAISQRLRRDDILSLMAPIDGFTGRVGASVNDVDEVRTAELGAALRAGDVRSYVDRHGTDYAP